MIAASVDDGRYRPRLFCTSRIATIAAAPTTPVSCVREPELSATIVREVDVLTGKPWKSPAATFAAPRARISRLASTCSPRRAARLRDVAVVSASVTKAMPAAATSSFPASLQPDVGKGRSREAGRDRADD